MATLEAEYTGGAAPEGWARALDPGREYRLGRRPDQADLVIRDPAVAGCQAVVFWDGSRVRVRVRDGPPPRNPIMYRGQPATAFDVGPGDTFAIGSTQFRVALTAPADDSEATVSHTRSQLNLVQYRVTPVAVAALDQVTEVLRLTHTDELMYDQMAGVLLTALPRAAAAAVVRSAAGQTEALYVKRRVADRAFAPNPRLIERAFTAPRANTLRVWIGGDTVASTPAAEGSARWAVCTPLHDDSDLGLYAEGELDRIPAISGWGTDDPELADYQKVLELFAGVIETARKVYLQGELLKAYQQFLPKQVRNVRDARRFREVVTAKPATLTILFCDVRGSSLVGAGPDLAAASALMMRALDDMTQAIIYQNGVVTEFLGDAVLAFWGWPDPVPDHTERAARAALRIRERFHELGFNAHLQCGLGLARGTAIVGGLGAHDLKKIGVFGPAVNLASRLESLTKRVGSTILTDAASAAVLRAADPGGTEWRLRQLPTVLPAGLPEPTAVSELIGREAGGILPEMNENQRRSWEGVVADFTAGRWSQATARLRQFYAHDPAGQYLLGVMDETAGRPPDGWDGVIRPGQK